MTRRRSTAFANRTRQWRRSRRRLHFHDQRREGARPRSRAGPAGAASLSSGDAHCRPADPHQPVRAREGAWGKRSRRRSTDDPGFAIDLDHGDVLVDFSSPAALQASLDRAVSAGIPILVGTTGLDDISLRRHRRSSEAHSGLRAPTLRSASAAPLAGRARGARSARRGTSRSPRRTTARRSTLRRARPCCSPRRPRKGAAPCSRLTVTASDRPQSRARGRSASPLSAAERSPASMR